MGRQAETVRTSSREQSEKNHVPPEDGQRSQSDQVILREPSKTITYILRRELIRPHESIHNNHLLAENGRTNE